MVIINRLARHVVSFFFSEVLIQELYKRTHSPDTENGGDGFDIY